MLVIVI